MKRNTWFVMIIAEFSLLGFLYKIGCNSKLMVVCFVIISFVNLLIFIFFYMRCGYKSINSSVTFEEKMKQQKKALAVPTIILFVAMVFLFLAVCIYARIGDKANFIIMYALRFAFSSWILYYFIALPISFIEIYTEKQCTSSSSTEKVDMPIPDNNKIECSEGKNEEKMS